MSLFLPQRNLKSKCSFKVTLRPETADLGTCACEIPVLMLVQGANLLHYALCIGSFQAAAALLISCPALLGQSCSVTATYSNAVVGSIPASCPDHAPGSTPALQAPSAAPETWSMAQVLGVFCRLYQHPETSSALFAAGYRYRNCLNFLLIRQLNLVPDMVRYFPTYPHTQIATCTCPSLPPSPPPWQTYESPMSAHTHSHTHTRAMHTHREIHTLWHTHTVTRAHAHTHTYTCTHTHKP